MTIFTLPGIPGDLSWTNGPVSGRYDDQGLHMTAGRETDLFTDPAGTMVKDDSPRLTFTPDPLFTLSAHVHVDFAATYDAGVLILYVDTQHWAKFCFEYSPHGKPMIVSVVTNGVSDDCNAVPLTRRDILMRVTRLGNAFAFHFSEDGVMWMLVRYFALHETANLVVGFSSQSPTGEGCHSRFTDIRYAPVAVTDIRPGNRRRFVETHAGGRKQVQNSSVVESAIMQQQTVDRFVVKPVLDRQPTPCARRRVVAA